MDLVARQLHDIRALIVRKGWFLPGVRNYHGFPTWLSLDNIGLMEAILEVCRVSRAGKETIRLISLAVAPKGRGTSLEIVEWEERYGRCQADILRALDLAAASAPGRQVAGHRNVVVSASWR